MGAVIPSLSNAEAEMAAFWPCMTGPGGSIGEDCAALDFDLDRDIDLEDFRVLQALFDEPR